MTDRELLELAAKAAGIELDFEHDPWHRAMIVTDNVICSVWNPLTDDGDALRLAVKLSISIDPNATIVAAACNIGGDYFEEQASDFNGDLCAATRRAVVRAAAEIGKGM